MSLVLILIIGLIIAIFFTFVLISFNLLTFALYYILAILVIIIVLFISYSFQFYQVIFKKNAPYVRTRHKLIETVLENIDFSAKGGSASGGKDNAKVYEIGCGDALFLRTLVKKKNVQAVGIEYFIIPYFFARFFNFFSKNKIKIKCKDFFKVDLSDADYIFCYLFPDEMERVEEKLQKELKPGAVVISNTFKFKNWQSEKIIIIDENKKTGLSNKIYVYRK